MTEEQVVLVDENDNKVGLMGKLAAHKGEGTLHRAISVVIYRSTKTGTEILLQKRGVKKPLWPFYWSNTVCTHPRDGESYEDCAERRLREEMGIKLPSNKLKFLFKMPYQARYNQELSERELDGVIEGKWDGEVALNPDEAADYKWVGWQDLLKDIDQNSEIYTPWFKLLVERLEEMGWAK